MTIIDMSSSDPSRSRKLAEVLAEHHITTVDAPISGGVKRAHQGTLTIMFGGSGDSLQRCEAI